METEEQIPESPILFQVIDPRGRLVTCTEECWNYHVLDSHPIMAGTEAEVVEAIRDPHVGFIYQDRDFPERQIYYRRTYSSLYYVKVVVDFSNPESGEVVTAFKVDYCKAGEVIIWPE